MTDLSKIKTKIAALLAKANGTDNENEAAAFAAKAHELLEAYQLNLFDLGESDPMGKVGIHSGNGSTPTWKAHLINSIAKYYGCRLIRNKFQGGAFEMNLHGRESARITVELMVPFIFDQCRKAAKELRKEGHAGTTEHITRLITNALTTRIYMLSLEEAAKAKNNAGEATMEGRAARNALTTVNELDAYIDSLYSNLKAGSSKRKMTSDAAREAAGKVSLNRQMSNGAGTLRIK